MKFFRFRKIREDLKNDINKETKQTSQEKKLAEWQKFFLYRFADHKEYKNRRLAFAAEAAPILIDGCGGIKNITNVKVFNYFVIIKFRNLYQIKEDVLKTSGGLRLKIQDHEVSDIFDFPEAKAIVAIIKKEIKRAKMMFVKLDMA